MAAALLDEKENSGSAPMVSRLVPAWKRLGLKLKFDNEDTERSTKPQGAGLTNQRKRRAADPPEALDGFGLEYNVKKRIRPSSHDIRPDRPDVQALSPPPRRESNGIRKTVSFTPETKTEDGDTSRSLIAGWEAKYDKPALSVTQPTESQPRNDQVPRAKKLIGPPDINRPHAALSYLTQFQESRSSWKFNKRRGTWLLKHLFSVDDIPPEYNLALSNYLQGLKSVAARSRIRREAETAIRKDQKHELEYTTKFEKEKDEQTLSRILPAGMEDPDRRREYYEDSVRRYRRQLESHLNGTKEELSWVSQDRLAKRRRAEIAFWATAPDPPGSEIKPDDNAMVMGQIPIPNGDITGRDQSTETRNLKKRKNRTTVVEVSSSSSNDESSADESEEDEGKKSNTNPDGESSSDEENHLHDMKPRAGVHDAKNRNRRTISAFHTNKSHHKRLESPPEISASISTSSDDSDDSDESDSSAN